MILEEPILNNLGFVLVPSGFRLTEKHVKMLNNWNIKTVNIVSEANDEDQEISPELLEKAKEIVGERIKWQPRNEFEQIMIEKAIYYIADLIKQNKYNN